MNYRLVSERLYIAAFNVLITGLIVHPYMLRDRVINKGTPVDMRSFSGNQVTLWTADEMPELARWSYQEFVEHQAIQLEALSHFLRWGVFLLDDAPTKPGEVLNVISTFGYVRETNYGALFDVQSKIDPANQAFTRLGLNAHTDNPYRDPVPTVQLLHCLANSAEGGDTFLLDGFKAAAILRDKQPEAFNTLSQCEVAFRYSDDKTDLKSSVRLIETGSAGDIRHVRFNDRSINVTAMPYELQQLFYPAYRFWATALANPQLRMTHKLRPGELIIFDNTRVMHGRHAYENKGERHLQGAYSDLDGLYSALYTLSQQLEGL